MEFMIRKFCNTGTKYIGFLSRQLDIIKPVESPYPTQRSNESRIFSKDILALTGYRRDQGVHLPISFFPKGTKDFIRDVNVGLQIKYGPLLAAKFFKLRRI